MDPQHELIGRGLTCGEAPSTIHYLAVETPEMAALPNQIRHPERQVLDL